MLTLLIAVFLIVVTYWASRALLDAFKIDEPIRTVVLVLVVVIGLLWIVNFLAPGTLAPLWRF